MIEIWNLSFLLAVSISNDVIWIEMWWHNDRVIFYFLKYTVLNFVGTYLNFKLNYPIFCAALLVSVRKYNLTDNLQKMLVKEK